MSYPYRKNQIEEFYYRKPDLRTDLTSRVGIPCASCGKELNPNEVKKQLNLFKNGSALCESCLSFEFIKVEENFN